jgi:hypothetical protein
MLSYIENVSAPAPRTEEELLEREDRLARDGLRRTTKELGEDLVDVLELRRQVQQHPLVSMVTSLCTGFVVARPFLKIVGPREARTAITSIARLAVRFAGLGVIGNALSALMPETRRHKPF